MGQYRRKPVEVEARQFGRVGPDRTNLAELIIWIKSESNQIIGTWTRDKIHDERIDIGTREGIKSADVGDWIIRGATGEFVPCPADLFEDIYDEVVDLG